MGSWLETATYDSYNYFKGDRMPSDFFQKYGADSLKDEFFHHFNPLIDITPNANIGLTNDDIGGFTF